MVRGKRHNVGENKMSRTKKRTEKQRGALDTDRVRTDDIGRQFNAPGSAREIISTRVIGNQTLDHMTLQQLQASFPFAAF